MSDNVRESARVALRALKQNESIDQADIIPLERWIGASCETCRHVRRGGDQGWYPTLAEAGCVECMRHAYSLHSEEDVCMDWESR